MAEPLTRSSGRHSSHRMIGDWNRLIVGWLPLSSNAKLVDLADAEAVPASTATTPATASVRAAAARRRGILGLDFMLFSSDVAIAMVGVHVLIGIGEATITGLTVGAVLSTRPDLVYGARDLRPALAGAN